MLCSTKMGNLFAHPSVIGAPLSYKLNDDFISIKMVGVQGMLGTFRMPKRGDWKKAYALLHAQKDRRMDPIEDSYPDYFNKHPGKM